LPFLYDNLKSAVLERRGDQIHFNPRLLSKKNSRYRARDQDKVMTKHESWRLARPTMTEPK
jgi:hypothetical protein